MLIAGTVRLLIVKTSSMGDVVHALPVLGDLRRRCPEAEIDWLVEPSFAAIPSLHPAISQVHRLPWRKWRKQLWKPSIWRAMGELRRTLRECRYTAVIDLQGLYKSALWACQAEAPVVGYNAASAREPGATRLYQHTHAVPRDLQAVDRCRHLVAAHFAWNVPSLGPADFGLHSVASGPAHASVPSQPYAVLVPNASRHEKLWPNEHWQAVGRTLLSQGLKPVVLWGSPAEQAMAQAIAQGCEGEVPPYLKVDEAAGLLARARLVVGLDTGFSHLAAALGRPVVGIYCDHEPGLAGLTGSGPVRCLGGKGQRPSLQEVLQALKEVQADQSAEWESGPSSD